jgi:hypothetical protein
MKRPVLRHKADIWSDLSVRRRNMKVGMALRDTNDKTDTRAPLPKAGVGPAAFSITRARRHSSQSGRLGPVNVTPILNKVVKLDILTRAIAPENGGSTRRVYTVWLWRSCRSPSSRFEWHAQERSPIWRP